MIEENILNAQPELEFISAKQIQISYKKNNWKLKRWIWENASVDELNYRVGDRVWPAGESYKDYFCIKQIKSIGEKFFPDGGVICYTMGGAERIFNLDAVIKHPQKEEIKQKVYKFKRKK